MLNLDACVLRICDTEGNTRGTGFVVSESLAVTCAHVVEMCGAGPGGRVRVVFRANGQEREARVQPEYWQPADKDDVAFLRLLPEGEPLPAGVTPAALGTAHGCHGHKMRVLGFPQLPGGYKEAYAEGELRGVVSHANKRPMLQMDAKPIYEGMSGAPVFDLTKQCVVGMMCEYLRDAPLEWATTAETLLAICPDLELVPAKPLRIFQVQMADRHAEKGQMPPPLAWFPADTAQVFLVFRYANMPAGQSLSANVYDSTARLVSEWSHHYEDQDPAGVSSCLLSAFAGEFAPGDYRVEIQAGDQLVGEARFTVKSSDPGAWPALARSIVPSTLDLASIEIARDPVDNYYLLYKGVQHQIPHQAEATLRDIGMMFGRRLADRRDTSPEELARFPEGQPLPNTAPWIARTREDGKLYWIKPRIELTEESGKLCWTVVNQKKEIVNEQMRVALAGGVPPITVLRQELDRYINLGHVPDYFGVEAEQARPRLIQGKEWGHQYLQLGRIWRHIPYGVKLQTVGTIGEPVEERSETELEQGQIEGVPVQSAEWLVELWMRRVSTTRHKAATMQENKYDLQVVRELLNAAFSDEDITTLAFDRFREVYDDFSGAMSKSERIRRLVDWCDRNLQMKELLAQVQKRNPHQYARYASRLGRQ